jgi:hypothetical protein
LTIRLGDRRQGSPGLRLQTNVERNVELRTSVDAFAAYEFCELGEQPAFDLVAGQAAHWKAMVPSLVVAGEPFRLAIVAEDMWGNPTADAAGGFELRSSLPVHGLPAVVTVAKGDGPRVIEGLLANDIGDLDLSLIADGAIAAQANPPRVAAAALLGRSARPERRDHRNGDRGRIFPLRPRPGFHRHGRPPGQ